MDKVSLKRLRSTLLRQHRINVNNRSKFLYTYTRLRSGHTCDNLIHVAYTRVTTISPKLYCSNSRLISGDAVDFTRQQLNHNRWVLNIVQSNLEVLYVYDTRAMCIRYGTFHWAIHTYVYPSTVSFQLCECTYAQTIPEDVTYSNP